VSVATYHSVDVILEARAELGESPSWDDSAEHLGWVDILRGELHVTDPATGNDTVVSAGIVVGAARPTTTVGRWAVATADGFGYLALDGTLDLVDPVLRDQPQRMNDAGVDPIGRLWAGSMGWSAEPGQGALHTWDGVAPSVVAVDGLSLPNGIAWSPDGQTLYFVDTVARHVFTASYAPADGHIGRIRPLLALPDALPDGLVVDAEGALWIALWGRAEVRRYAPDGRWIGRVTVPVSQPTSCALAPDGTLFVTSARIDLGEETLAREPLAGAVFAVHTGVPGLPTARFHGGFPPFEPKPSSQSREDASS